MVIRSRNAVGRGLGWGPFLAGFVPGLLQFQLGQKPRAVLAFLSCTLLFFAGWMIVGERLFYWALLTPDATGSGPMRMLARFGLGLGVPLPELLNMPANALGAMLAWDDSPTGERLWRMPRDFEHIGAWLTGASGMLAAFCDGRLSVWVSPGYAHHLGRPRHHFVFLAMPNWILLLLADRAGRCTSPRRTSP